MPIPTSPVFLDRDGTLIVEKMYLSNPEDVCVENGVVEGLTILQDYGHPLIVISNQSGIGQGKYNAIDAQRVNARLAEILRDHGIGILAWYLCPHAPDALCACRKPLPGMPLAASRDLSLDLVGSYVIGDKRSDLELADAIGAEGILVTTGHGGNAADWARAQSRTIFESFRRAAEYIAQNDIEASGTCGQSSNDPLGRN